jgi:hypothetical protein
VKAAIGSVFHRFVPLFVFVVSVFAIVVLTACGALRFPELTPEPPGPTADVETPTLASLLLTPAATSTPPPTSSALDPTPTPTFGLPRPEPTCSATPMWGLGDVWNNLDVRTRLGCLVGDQTAIAAEELYFEGGHMLWRPDAGLIYVLFDHPWQPQGWGAFVDTFQASDIETDPTIADPTPMADMPIYMQPQGRFGKLWRENAWLRDRLGWAQIPYDGEGGAMSSITFDGAVQDFQHGVLLWNGDVCFVLRNDDMSWDMY